MKASEAKQTALGQQLNEFWKYCDKVMDEIKHYAGNGKTIMNYYHPLPKSVEDHLKELGYVVIKTSDGRNGFDITISWN
jgi:hypothetical protein